MQTVGLPVHDGLHENWPEPSLLLRTNPQSSVLGYFLFADNTRRNYIESAMVSVMGDNEMVRRLMSRPE
jgi:hypothetical protein